MLKARKVLEMGCRWNIGDGNKVKIWGSKWLPRQNASRIITAPRLLGPDSYVSDLIDPIERKWRVELVQNIFLPLQAIDIMSIHMATEAHADYVIWEPETDGVFLVRMAYRLIRRAHFFHEGSPQATTSGPT